MIIPRITATLLHEVSQFSQRSVEVNKYLAEKNREKTNEKYNFYTGCDF